VRILGRAEFSMIFLNLANFRFETRQVWLFGEL
jgi:hypothetical protein